VTTELENPQSEAGAGVREIDPVEAFARKKARTLLLDVREDHERASGMPSGAIGIARAQIPARIREIAGDPQQEILTICGTGRRSLLAAETLRELGYANVASVRGGLARWLAEGLPLDAGLIDADSAERYARHLILPEVGVAGQTKLLHARIALIGAGGLGAPAALYLAAAGVGTLSLIDDDRVERSNLQRQVLHTDERIGMHKTESAAIALRALNPRTHLELRDERLTAANVEALVRDHDVVIDGADNFPTRYLLNAACLRLKIPLVYGAVHRFTGQVSVFDARSSDSPCYRCLFPEPPSAAEAPNCSEAGVLGVLPGVIGMLQATEAIKLVLGVGRTLAGRLLCYDALSAEFRELRLPRDPACPGCGANAVFTGYEDIARFCGDA
jgi:molybdopterin/thiamine biosynthesis adenylyltransferase/rhodanese-related sulfurtransferase